VSSSSAAAHVQGDHFFRASHVDLVRRVRPRLTDRRGPLPEAIVVPTSRPSQHRRPGLRLAIDLASEFEIPLVVLCSRDAASPGSLTDLQRWIERHPQPPDTAVLVLNRAHTEATEFRVDRSTVALAFRTEENRSSGRRHRSGRNDVGRKRNLGLLLASSMGWKTILCLDDDILVNQSFRDLRRSSLAAAVRWVSRYDRGAVGWIARDFPDNSVVCRIRSRLGYEQGQFLGGGALVVRVDGKVPFFPAIYNEDWLFMLGLLHRNPQGLGEAGVVGQAPYKGFSQWRAKSEEFGDILAEAMMTMVQESCRCATEPAYWARAFRARSEMRAQLQRDLRATPISGREQMQHALSTLQHEVHADVERHEDFWARQFVQFTRSWEQDLHDWQARVAAAAAQSPMHLLRSGEFDLARSRVVGSLSEFDRFSAEHARGGRTWRLRSIVRRRRVFAA
jgi:hypothetical protein